MTSRSRIVSFVFLALFSVPVILASRPAAADPTLGFTEEFPGTSFGNWTSPWLLGNPATGGVGGNGDGFLTVNTTAGFLGAKTSASDYIGNYTATGVTQIRLWVKDVSGAGGLQLHLALGNQGNFWQCNLGVDAAADRWKLYVVDLVEANFTQIVGSGTFTNALSNVDRVLVRHDVAPFVQNPDLITAILGIDHILLTNGVTGVEPATRIATGIEIDAAYPNPARNVVSFSIRSATAGALSLRVLDISGRQVRRAVSSGGVSSRLWMWDGRDESGRAAPAGRYVFEASGAGGTSRRSFTLLR